MPTPAPRTAPHPLSCRGSCQGAVPLHPSSKGLQRCGVDGGSKGNWKSGSGPKRKETHRRDALNNTSVADATPGAHRGKSHPVDYLMAACHGVCADVCRCGVIAPLSPHRFPGRPCAVCFVDAAPLSPSVCLFACAPASFPGTALPFLFLGLTSPSLFSFLLRSFGHGLQVSFREANPHNVCVRVCPCTHLLAWSLPFFLFLLSRVLFRRLALCSRLVPATQLHHVLPVTQVSHGILASLSVALFLRCRPLLCVSRAHLTCCDLAAAGLTQEGQTKKHARTRC